MGVFHRAPECRKVDRLNDLSSTTPPSNGPDGFVCQRTPAWSLSNEGPEVTFSSSLHTGQVGGGQTELKTLAGMTVDEKATNNQGEKAKSYFGLLRIHTSRFYEVEETIVDGMRFILSFLRRCALDLRFVLITSHIG